MNAREQVSFAVTDSALKSEAFSSNNISFSSLRVGNGYYKYFPYYIGSKGMNYLFVEASCNCTISDGRWHNINRDKNFSIYVDGIKTNFTYHKDFPTDGEWICFGSDGFYVNGEKIGTEK